jgi:DNA-binding NarL/FixJ family response regulator
MNETPIRLALVDDHRSVRQAFRIALSQYNNLQVIFEAENGQELITRLAVQQPDVILLDLKMSKMSGLESLKIINREYSNVRVLILSAFLDQIYVSQCLEHGINGYLTKSMDLHEIINAIEQAYKNEVYYTNLLRDVYFKKYIRHFHKNEIVNLPIFSSEELQIIRLIGKEKTTEEISEILFLSKRSIEIKREKIKEKANVKTIGGLMVYSLKRGFID